MTDRDAHVARTVWEAMRPFSEQYSDVLYDDVVRRPRYRHVLAVLEKVVSALNPETQQPSPADAMIAQIEERFPDWRSFRDLIDCIDVTLHELRGPASLVVKDPDDPDLLNKLRDRKATFMLLRADPDHLADAWNEISAALARADGYKTGLVLACAMIERRRLRLGLQPIGSITVEPDAPVPTVTTGDWPSGCHDPDSCARHQACMYVQCPRHGTDVAAAIVRHRAPCGRRGGSCACQQESECINYGKFPANPMPYSRGAR